MRKRKQVQICPRKVLLVMELRNYADREVLVGILRHPKTKTAWSPKLVTFPESQEIDLSGVDGAIISGRINDETVLRNSCKKTIPIVCSHPISKILNHTNCNPYTKIKLNDIAIGESGARHLLSLGKFRGWGFVPHKFPDKWSCDREKGFLRTLKANGIDADVFRANAANPPNTLSHWIKKLSKPAAIMCAWDVKATEVLTICRDEKINVPKEVVVLGVDNDPILCNTSTPTLSSVIPDFEKLGHNYVEALDALMRNESPRNKYLIACPPKGIAHRESTSTPVPAATLIHRALSIIKSNEISKLTVSDIARRLGVSTNLLSLRFREFQHETVRDTILAHKLSKVKSALTHSKKTVQQIANESGFSSANHLSHIFKEKFSVSIREWRAKP